MTQNLLDSLKNILWPPDQIESSAEVYALLDGARDPRIVSLLRRSNLDYRCLYAGKIPRALEEAAPYLVPLSRESSLTADFLRLGWGNAWGIFLQSSASSHDLCRHFRRFLKVRDEHSKAMIFRYYDPRVLREFLPTCIEEELRFLFDQIDGYVVEGLAPTSLSVFRFDAGLLAREDVELITVASRGGRWGLNRPSVWPQDAAMPSGMAQLNRRKPYLVVRDEQLRRLSEVRLDEFEQNIISHINTFFPTLFPGNEPARLRNFIRRGVERAESFGITARDLVVQYIDLMLVFGADYDTTTSLNWAGEILRGSGTARERIARLKSVALSRLDTK